MTKVKTEVKEAYADCWMDDFEESAKIRNLDFAASKYVSKQKAKDILSKYVKEYNAFTPDLLDHLPDDSQVKLAREGSVCLYFKSKELGGYSKSQINEISESLGADEFSFENGEYRVWWD